MSGLLDGDITFPWLLPAFSSLTLCPRCSYCSLLANLFLRAPRHMLRWNSRCREHTHAHTHAHTHVHTNTHTDLVLYSSSGRPTSA